MAEKKEAAESAASSGFRIGVWSDLHRLGDFGGVVLDHLLDAFAAHQALEADDVATAAFTACSTVLSLSST